MKKNNASAKFAKIMGSYGMILILLLLIICFAVSIPQGRFLSSSNIFNVLRQVSIVGIIAVGMTFIMLTGGLPVFGFDKNFTKLGQGYLGPIPIPVIIMVIVFILGAFFLAKTKAGRHIYGVGGNEEASRLSGVNITKIKLLVYSVGGLCSALGGLVMLARTNSGQPNGGEGYEMDVVTAVVLGGISMNGGQGRIGMVIVGVLIMGILSNGMTMLGINEFVQKFVRGLVLIGAVALNNFIKKKNEKTTSAN